MTTEQFNAGNRPARFVGSGFLEWTAWMGLAALAAVALSPACFAEAVYDETTGFVTLLKSDSSSVFSLSDTGNWSDVLPPHRGTNYYVKSGWVARSDGINNLDFPAPLYVAGTIVPTGTKAVFNFADLKLLDGSIVTYGKLYTLGGNIEILATDESSPAILDYPKNRS